MTSRKKRPVGNRALLLIACWALAALLGWSLLYLLWTLLVGGWR